MRYNACLTFFSVGQGRFSVVRLVVNTLIVYGEILLHEGVGKWNIIADSLMSLMDPASMFTMRITILKYPLV